MEGFHNGDCDIWDESIHKATGQAERMKRGFEQPIKIISFDDKTGVAEIEGTSGEHYNTSLFECSCPDYFVRHLPCKHMYHLALKLDSSVPRINKEEGNISHLPISNAKHVIHDSPLGQITMETEFSCHTVEIMQQTPGILPSVSLNAWDGYVSPSGGYVNYGTYQVIGINPNTKRKNKRTYHARDEDLAIQQATLAGFIEPFEITILPSEPPSDRQIEYAESLGALIPQGACKKDVSSIISRITNDDEAALDEETARQAFISGIQFSRYSGYKEVQHLLISSRKSISYK